MHFYFHRNQIPIVLNYWLRFTLDTQYSSESDMTLIVSYHMTYILTSPVPTLTPSYVNILLESFLHTPWPCQAGFDIILWSQIGSSWSSFAWKSTNSPGVRLDAISFLSLVLILLPALLHPDQLFQCTYFFKQYTLSSFSEIADATQCSILCSFPQSNVPLNILSMQSRHQCDRLLMCTTPSLFTANW